MAGAGRHGVVRALAPMPRGTTLFRPRPATLALAGGPQALARAALGLS